MRSEWSMAAEWESGHLMLVSTIFVQVHFARAIISTFLCENARVIFFLSCHFPPFMNAWICFASGIFELWKHCQQTHSGIKLNWKKKPNQSPIHSFWCYGWCDGRYRLACSMHNTCFLNTLRLRAKIFLVFIPSTITLVHTYTSSDGDVKKSSTSLSLDTFVSHIRTIIIIIL